MQWFAYYNTKYQIFEYETADYFTKCDQKIAGMGLAYEDLLKMINNSGSSSYATLKHLHG